MEKEFSGDRLPEPVRPQEQFKGANKVTVSRNKKVSKVIKGLKKGKKYYVRIRCYKKIGSKKFYSAWSARKAVIIKE